MPVPPRRAPRQKLSGNNLPCRPRLGAVKAPGAGAPKPSPMIALLDDRVPGTLDELLPRLERETAPGASVEAWLFEGVTRRRAAERRLGKRGIAAVLRSAYKPLVHFFLEEVDAGTLRRVTVRYPVHERAHPKRFLLEAYPLAALLPGVETAFVEGQDRGHYHVDFERRTGERDAVRVFAPNRVREDHLGAPVLAPSGWLRITEPGTGDVRIDEPLVTEYETIFRRALDAVRAYDWGTTEPYFDRLVISAEIPDVDRPLPFGEECLSTCEALHEDLYFSVLEFFKRRAGRAVTDRTAQPGQVVPDIRQAASAPLVRVTLDSPAGDGPVPGAPAEPAPADGGRGRRIDEADRPLELPEIMDETAALEGGPIAARSRRGRPVLGVYRPGRHPAIVVTAGQHANETTGVVGALRAASRLAEDPDASFAVIPLENPDGYALHRRLCAINPRHMHHAARYTALGDDLQSRSRAPWYEKAARIEAQRLSGARLHINLHGYPSHEWTRPLTGYLPRGFETWSIPKGFYVILRHHGEWAARVPALLDALTARLAMIPGLAELNRAQLAAYEAHTGERPAPILHGIPCQITEDDEAPFPLAIITEFPDETIYGELFVLAHAVQMETVLAAAEIYRGLSPA